MKNLTILILAIILTTINAVSQIINVNPDTNGEPWIGGDFISLAPEIESALPIMILSQVSDTIPLDSVVDNSQYIFMPPVFNQEQSGSCVHIAEIWYTFGYEINRLRNDTAGYEYNDEYRCNQFHPFYSYNGTYLTLSIFHRG